MLNFQVVIFKFQIKIYHKRPSPAPPAAKKGWRWMAFSDGSQYHDWIRQEKKMLFPKKTLVYLVQYSIRTSNLWRLPHVRQTTKKKTSPPAPPPKKKQEMWGEVPKIPQWGAGIPSWESIKVDSPNQLLQDSKVVSLQLRSAEILFVPPSPGEECTPMLGVTHLGNWIWCQSITI